MGADMSRKSSARHFSYAERRSVLVKKRQEAGVSQAQWADLAGVTVFTVSRFETGQRDVKASTLRKLEDAMADILAGQRMTQMLNQQRGRTAPLSKMMAAPSRPSNDARDIELADLRQQVEILRDMVSLLQERDARFDEAYTLMREVVDQYAKEGFERPKEANALLKRAQLLVAKK